MKFSRRSGKINQAKHGLSEKNENSLGAYRSLRRKTEWISVNPLEEDENVTCSDLRG